MLLVLKLMNSFEYSRNEYEVRMERSSNHKITVHIFYFVSFMTFDHVNIVLGPSYLKDGPAALISLIGSTLTLPLMPSRPSD
jgi:hypothetical protein